VRASPHIAGGPVAPSADGTQHPPTRPTTRQPPEAHIATLSVDDEYREDAVLRDGRRVRVRTVRPADKARLAAGLRKLSPASQVARFFTTKVAFTPAELEYLTELDGVDHFALGALELHFGGREGEGVGLARFVRRDDDPEVAEAAVAVVDGWQGHGLGRLLLERLVVAARERGVRRFRVEFLAENRTVRTLLDEACPGLPMRADGPALVAEVPLPALELPPGAAHRRAPLFALLRLAARRVATGR
jgi:GNAT superfamily N-acetyltransferase